MTLTRFIDTAPTLMQSVFGLTQINRGQQLSRQATQAGINATLQGGAISAAALRSKVGTVRDITEYNIALDRQDLNLQLDAAARQTRELLATQRAQAGVSGLASGSKSFLLAANETINRTNQALMQARQNAETAEAQTRFSSVLSQVDLENQARNAEYSASVSAYNLRLQQQQADYAAEQQRGDAITGIINQGFSLFGGI